VSRRSFLRLGALAVLWGSGFLFVKVALAGLSPFQVVAGRLVAGSLGMLAITIASRQALPRGRDTWAHLGVMAVITNIAPCFLFAWAELRVSSGLAGVLNATTPLFTQLIALAAGLESAVPSRLMGLAVGLGGVVLLAAPWSSGGHSTRAGVLAALAASACYAVGYVYARRFLTPRRLPALVLSAGQAAAGAALLGSPPPSWA
jgi:drug/metabolite transporter (DMT)-like permease